MPISFDTCGILYAMFADQIVYHDTPGHRVLDLRPDGVDCIPSLRFSNCQSVQQSPDFHYHPGCMEFSLCRRGNLIFDTREREYPFLPGHVFVSSPDEPHHLRTNPSGLVVYSILFAIPHRHNARLLGLDARGSEWLARSLTHLPKRLFAATPAVRAAFDRLFTVYDTVGRKSPARRVKMRAAALDLLLALIDAARRLPAKAPDKVNEIAARIQDAPADDYPIQTLARQCNRSVSAFAADFKRAKGLPLHAFILNCRVNRAKRLLSKTNRTVAAIGQELRFCSTQHFARTFRRIIGVSPLEYRRAAQPA